jgi:hypothetical protein
VHGALVLRILAPSLDSDPPWMQSRAVRRAALLRVEDTAYLFSDGPGPGCGNPNRRMARILDVCLRH